MNFLQFRYRSTVLGLIIYFMLTLTLNGVVGAIFIPDADPALSLQENREKIYGNTFIMGLSLLITLGSLITATYCTAILDHEDDVLNVSIFGIIVMILHMFNMFLLPFPGMYALVSFAMMLIAIYFGYALSKHY